MYRVEVKKLDNYHKFTQDADNFKENGYYCSAPKGTKEYRDYWVEQLDRSINGFTTEDGDYISGYFYFYLNFCQIIRTVQSDYVAKNGLKYTKKERKRGFPDFYDYDRAYFDAIDEAERNGKHLAVLKKRGSGYSFKGAAMLVRNFYCIAESNSMAIASEMEFLTKDGILSKAWDYMDFIDQNTAFAKKRQKVDTKTHKRASIVKDVNGVKTEVGYKSEIMGVSMKNDSQKVRGKRAKLILMEEGGRFPHVKTTWQVLRPSTEDDDGFAYGLMIIFGTGGVDDASFEGLKDIFYEPDGYNCLPIENVWDEGTIDKYCGFFVPQYVNMYGTDENGKVFMDENGNSDIRTATAYSMKEREKVIHGSSDRSSIDRYIAERPFTPQEACLEISGNIFPKKELIAHLASIRNNTAMREFKQVGELSWKSDGTIKWELNPEKKDLIRYRVKPGDSKDGAVVIWEHPEKDPPYGLYILGVDPYDFDKSTTNSLGSCFVYKRIQSFETLYGS